jgi:predicted TIM-barrel fold metal-dependent hydrolase
MPAGLIDVHAHYVPEVYRRALADAGIDRPDGFPFVPDWSAAGAVAAMDELGIDQALISVSSPGVDLGGSVDTARLARAVNDDGAEAVREHPARLRLLASLSLPDVDASLQEIRYAMDDLRADGIVLMTNYRGTYLGDPAFEPVMDELNGRGALVTLHPTSPPAADAVTLGRPRPMIEFPFDTTRAVINMVLNGTLRARPGIRLIVPHIGAALPALADRVQGFLRAFAQAAGELDVYAELRRMWFDTAGDPLPHALPALAGLVGADRILYGSDLPFAPVPSVDRTARALTEWATTGGDGWRRDNAAAVLVGVQEGEGAG